MSAVIKRNAFGLGYVPELYVIKPEDRRPGRHDLRGKEHLSPAQAARFLIEEAEKQGAQLISDAERDAENIRAEAYREGYDTGFKALDAQRAECRDRAEEMERDVQQQIEESWRALEPDILKLSVEIARQILREEVSARDDVVLTTIREGLCQIKYRQESKYRQAIRIHVSPSDFEIARARGDEISASCGGVGPLEIVDDRRVEAGGCMFDTGNGQLDARIETQLSEIERALLEEAQNGAVDSGAESG